MIKAKALDAVCGLRHGFLTRKGGVSQGIYASLNTGFGSGDDEAAVAENRGRALARLGLGDTPLCTAYQCHSADCVTVTEPWPKQAAPRADAMVTERPGIVLGVLTADCAPVIFADRDAGVIGVAHAGWKGALGGVMEAAVEAMVGLGAARPNIAAAIGPCIGRESYEVGAGFRAAFMAAGQANDGYFNPASRAGHYMFDLAAYAADRLEALGLATVENLGLDTYTDEQRFFSYRRSCHNGEGDYGRLLSLVALET